MPTRKQDTESFSPSSYVPAEGAKEEEGQAVSGHSPQTSPGGRQAERVGPDPSSSPPGYSGRRRGTLNLPPQEGPATTGQIRSLLQDPSRACPPRRKRTRPHSNACPKGGGAGRPRGPAHSLTHRARRRRWPPAGWRPAGPAPGAAPPRPAPGAGAPCARPSPPTPAARARAAGPGRGTAVAGWPWGRPTGRSSAARPPGGNLPGSQPEQGGGERETRAGKEAVSRSGSGVGCRPAPALTKWASTGEAGGQAGPGAAAAQPSREQSRSSAARSTSAQKSASSAPTSSVCFAGALARRLCGHKRGLCSRPPWHCLPLRSTSSERSASRCGPARIAPTRTAPGSPPDPPSGAEPVFVSREATSVSPWGKGPGSLSLSLSGQICCLATGQPRPTPSWGEQPPAPHAEPPHLSATAGRIRPSPRGLLRPLPSWHDGGSKYSARNGNCERANPPSLEDAGSSDLHSPAHRPKWEEQRTDAGGGKSALLGPTSLPGRFAGSGPTGR